MPLFPCVHHSGNTGKKPKIIFLAGFPDNETSSWGQVLPEKLSKDYDLFFTCLPGYEKGGKIPFWGYSFPQLIQFFDQTIDSIIGNEKTCTLVCHDWGAFVGLLYQTKFPNKVKKLVLLDVGMVTPYTATLKSLFYVTLYQLWFVLSFLVSRVLGVFIGTLFMGIFFLPIFRPLWPSHDRPPVPSNEIRADKCYPYFYLWSDLVRLKMPDQTFPKMPTLYMYGKQKNCMFHDQEFINTLQKRDDCDVKEVDAGHWLHIKKADEVYHEMHKFLSRK